MGSGCEQRLYHGLHVYRSSIYKCQLIIWKGKQCLCTAAAAILKCWAQGKMKWLITSTGFRPFIQIPFSQSLIKYAGVEKQGKLTNRPSCVCERPSLRPEWLKKGRSARRSEFWSTPQITVLISPINRHSVPALHTKYTLVCLLAFFTTLCWNIYLWVLDSPLTMSWSTSRLIKRLIVWLSGRDWFVCFNTDNTSNHLSLWSLHTPPCSAVTTDIWQLVVCVCVCVGVRGRVYLCVRKRHALLQQTHNGKKDKWKFTEDFLGKWRTLTRELQ